mmetsp:Transcript_7621/g.10910  ORF Transcript_7621/g.10910 Transcript_7621/m.10910 type:complete len:379 (+) Transcript_7621:276-1412(+)
MDVIIPSHNLKTFSSSISALGKIGKFLFLQFNPLNGLTLRTINDGKSAYAEFHFEVGFFERCTSPPGLFMGATRQSGIDRASSSVKDNEDDHVASEEEKENTMEEKYTCSVPVRDVMSILRPRRVTINSLRLRNVGGVSHHEIGGIDRPEEESMLMMLSFEFQVSSNNTLDNEISSSGSMHIVHRIGVNDSEGVATMTPREDCNEIVSHPRVLLKMLEPLKRTTEVALTVNDNNKTVTATSFHHTDADLAVTQNELLSATAAAVLKSETSIGCDKFDEYHWLDDRKIDDDGNNVLPDNVNEEVTLVFGIREAKAILQFCSQSSLEEEINVTLFFHWGGRPIIFDTEGTSFSAELVLATLDHSYLKDLSKARSPQQEQT